MSTQAYRNSAKIPGVWFLEEADLLELDSKIEAHFAALKKMNQSDVTQGVKQARKQLREMGVEEAEIKSQLDDLKKKELARLRNSPESRTIAIGGANSKELTICNSFAEARAGTSLLSEIPMTFKATLQAGKNLTEIALIDGWDGNRMEVAVQPDGPETAAFLVEIERWAESHRVERFLQWWHRQWMFWIFVLWVVFVIATWVFNLTVTTNAGLNAARSEAKTVVDQGITDSNRDQAISLLLRLHTDSEPKVTRLFSGWWSSAALCVTAALVWVIGMPPRSIIGIGRGKDRLYWRKQWYWFWTRFIPFTVVGSISVKVLVHMISSTLISK